MEIRDAGRRVGLSGMAYLLALPGILGGCSSLEVALGVKTRLEKEPVTSISARLMPDPALVPGKSAPLIITVTTADGKQLVTEGAGQGTVLFDSFHFVAHVVTVKSNGNVALPVDPRISDAVTPQLDITVVSHPSVGTRLDIPVNYGANFVADFSGQPGAPGFDGNNGLDGSPGSSGSTDPNNPTPGGNGSNGADGTDGDAGWPGQPGDAVRLWVTLLEDRSLLQIKATGSKGDQFFLVDSNKGSLLVRADGGPGGRGGSGGRGGQGGLGGSGWPPGNAGLAGRNGSDGRAGWAGPPGSFLVVVDPRAQPYLDRLHFSNIGGGQSGPSPQIRFEPVPRIW